MANFAWQDIKASQIGRYRPKPEREYRSGERTFVATSVPVKLFSLSESEAEHGEPIEIRAYA